MEIRVASTERALIEELRRFMTGEVAPSTSAAADNGDSSNHHRHRDLELFVAARGLASTTTTTTTTTTTPLLLRDKFANIELTESALDVGDVWVLAADANEEKQPTDAAPEGRSQAPGARRSAPCFVVERKSLDDLNASIIDGRYREQAIRLHSSGVVKGSPRQVVYLVECDARRWANMSYADQLKWNRVKTSLMIAPGHDFLLLESTGVRDSAFKLLSFATRAHELLEGGQPDALFFHPDGANDLGWTPLSEEDVRRRMLEAHAVSTKRQFNVVPEHFVPILLCCVPGVGIETARGIHARFPELAELVTFLTDTSRTEDEVLADLSSVCAASSGRRIGIAAARSVAKYLCPRRFYAEFTPAASATAKKKGPGAKKRARA